MLGGHFVFWQKKCGGLLWSTMQNLELLAWKMSELNLVFVGHFVFWWPFCFWRKKLQKVNVNYHAKSGASNLKNDWVMLNLFFVGHFVFWRKILRRVIENWLSYALFSFGGHFNFRQPFCFLEEKIVEGHCELPCKMWNFQHENWLSYAQFSFWWPCFWE